MQRDINIILINGAENVSECNESIVYTFSDRQAWQMEQDNFVLLLKLNKMSRLKQSQNIDSLIQGINTIIENRCSLSEEDLKTLNEALTLLQNLRRKKGKTNKDILKVVVKIVELISKFLTNDSEI